MLLLTSMLLLSGMILLVGMSVLVDMLLKFFITSTFINYPWWTKWLSNDQLSIGSITGMFSRSKIFCNSLNVFRCTIFSLSHLTCYPLVGLVSMFPCSSSTKRAFFALGCYAYIHLWLVPIHQNDISSHFGLSFNCFFFIDAFPYWTIFPHMSFLLTIETFHIIVQTKSLIFVIHLIVIIVSMPSTLLPSLASIVMPTILSWWLVIWLVVKSYLVIGSRIILLLIYITFFALTYTTFTSTFMCDPCSYFLVH